MHSQCKVETRSAEDAVVNPDHSDSLEIRTFARLLRVLLQAEVPTTVVSSSFALCEELDWLELLLARLTPPSMDPGGLARPRQVVQRRLCGAPFDDVLGSTEQLQRFALRELRVAWFDLRRLLLLMKPLKLQLSCACEADLASFPYMSLAAAAQARQLQHASAKGNLT
ncbi:Protein archease-like [Durusdinium trenchii]|uniref:Protein archease-like n=1 Tax=Durusdinium trenchii TaxID=1381693 RepID=A0ABP0RDS3_9DINO